MAATALLLAAAPNEAAAHSSLHRLTAFLIDGPLDAAESSRLDRAWSAYPDPKKRRKIEDLTNTVDRATTPYQRALLRDKLIAFVYCPVTASSPDRNLQLAMNGVAAARAPLVVADCMGPTPYVVTRADVTAFLSEMRFWANATGIQRNQFDGSVDEWSRVLAKGYPKAAILAKERLAHAESRWLLVRTMWRTEGIRPELIRIVRDGAVARGSLSDGAISLHAALILGGARAGMDAQLRAYLNSAMGAQGFVDGAAQAARSWGQ
jgi:hypothetical protein